MTCPLHRRASAKRKLSKSSLEIPCVSDDGGGRGDAAGAVDADGADGDGPRRGRVGGPDGGSEWRRVSPEGEVEVLALHVEYVLATQKEEGRRAFQAALRRYCTRRSETEPFAGWKLTHPGRCGRNIAGGGGDGEAARRRGGRALPNRPVPSVTRAGGGRASVAPVCRPLLVLIPEGEQGTHRILPALPAGALVARSADLRGSGCCALRRSR